MATNVSEVIRSMIFKLINFSGKGNQSFNAHKTAIQILREKSKTEVMLNTLTNENMNVWTKIRISCINQMI